MLYWAACVKSPNEKNNLCNFEATCRQVNSTSRDANSKVPEGHHPRSTTLREALRGNVPLRGLCRGLSEGSEGVSLRVLQLRGSAGFCGGPRDFPRFFGGSDPMLVTLGNCWGQTFLAGLCRWSRHVM